MPNHDSLIEKINYSKIIRCLMYAMTYTRLDIAYVVIRLSRYTSKPSKDHWHAV